MAQQTEEHNFFDIPIEHFPDRSARWLLRDKENVRGLLEILAGELVERIDFTQLTQLNRSFISDTLREQESDIVFSVPFQGNPETDEILIYILIEHQSTVDAMMGFRVLFYMTQLWDAQRREWESKNIPKSQWRLRPILPIVFYTGEQRWQTPVSLTSIMDIPETLSEFVPRFNTLFLSVKETAASDLTRTGHPLGWLLTVLQKEREDIASLRDALIAAVAGLNASDAVAFEQGRRAIMYLLLLILHRRPVEEQEALLTLVNRHAAEEMEVEKMAQSMAEVLIERGKAVGIEQGIEQGEIRAKQAAILKLMQLRFDTVPEVVVNEINAIGSRSRLDSLFEEVLAVEKLDEIDLQNNDG